MKENDVVILTDDGLDDVLVGTVGTIIHVYSNTVVCEVEFVIEDDSIIKTLSMNQLKKF